MKNQQEAIDELAAVMTALEEIKAAQETLTAEALRRTEEQAEMNRRLEDVERALGIKDRG